MGISFHDTPMDRLKSIHFPTGNFFLEIFGNFHNFGNTSADVPAPVVHCNALGTAKLVKSVITPSHTSSEVDFVFMWVPYQTAVVGFTLDVPPVPIFGTIGWENVDAMLAHYGGVVNMVNIGANFDGFGVANPFGNITGPVLIWEPNAAAPVPVDWGSVTTASPLTALTTARATFWGNQLLARAVASDSLGNHYFAPGPINVNTEPYSFFRERAVSFDFLIRCGNNKTKPAAEFSFSNILPAGSGIHGTGGLNILAYTTSDPAGTKSITSAQADRIVKTGNPTVLGNTADNGTGLGYPALVENIYQFTLYRDNKARPLWTGVHIIVTPPIPSV